MSKELSFRLVTILLCVLSFPAWADCGPSGRDICAAGSPWGAANFVKLEVREPNATDVTSFTLTVTDPLNLVIDQDNISEGKDKKGTIMLLEGRAMLTRGIALEKGYEIDALDAPILTYQILVSLLSEAIPDGPEKLVGTKSINITEKTRGIRVATLSASGHFRPPWSLVGSISRTGEDTVDLSLRFTYKQNKSSAVLLFDGVWKKLLRPPQMDSSMSLHGWQLNLLGPVEIRQKGSTILDYSTASKEVPLGTLGELRKAILADEKRSNPTLQGTPASGRP